MLNAAALLIPVFLFVMLFEWYVSYKRGDNKYTVGNTFMNLAIGAIDQISGLVYFALLYIVMQYVYTHFRIFEIKSGWYQWVVGYIAVDFLSYFYHRLSHRVNILWAGHVTHHSSELFNFSNGFRTSLFQGINRIAFWALLPIFGFNPVALVIILKVSGIYDFLQHTEYIPKLGFIEKIFITPSTHRVHHGKNDIYIDKNYGSTLLIWDKMFGTYQEETEKVRYGIKSSYTDKNPLLAIGHHYQYLWKTIKAIPGFRDRIKFLFMPPEWKPVEAKELTAAAVNNKLNDATSFKYYAYFQLLFCVTGLITMLIYQDFLTYLEIILYSTIGIISLYNVALIFNQNIRYGFVTREIFRLSFSLLLVLLIAYWTTEIYVLCIILFLSVSLLLIGMSSKILADKKIFG